MKGALRALALGEGKRSTMTLVSSDTTTTGVVVLTYNAEGRGPLGSA